MDGHWPDEPIEQIEDEAVKGRRAKVTKWASTIVAVAIVAAFTIYLWSRLPILETRTVTGEVRCSSGQPVQGVWVKVIVGDQSNNGFAEHRPHPGDLAATVFSRSVKAKSYVLHVGCGGTREDWGMTAYSAEIESATPKLVCFDEPRDPRYQTCGLLNG